MAHHRHYMPTDADDDDDNELVQEYVDTDLGDGDYSEQQDYDGLEIEVVENHDGHEDGNHSQSEEDGTYPDDDSSSGSGHEIEIEIEGDDEDGNFDVRIEVAHGDDDGESEETDSSDENSNEHDVSIEVQEGHFEIYEEDVEPEETEPDEDTDEEPSLKVIVSNDRTYEIAEMPNTDLSAESLPVLASNNRHLFEDCSICFNHLYKRNKNCCYLECFHWYHFTCLKSWSEKKRQCPVCRTEFSNILKPVPN